MYGGGGNCQVMSSIGGNNVVTSPDSLFSSSPMGNPNNNNLNFMTNMPFNPFSSIIPKEEVLGLRSKEEEVMESGSGSGHLDGGASIDEQEDEQINKPKKKRYHRHTARQIQEMESLFKECPHPDDKQRMRLSQELGLKPRQVKFWFQNRRTQMKAQQDRTDNVILRAENENLKNDNYRLQAALRNVICPSCGGPAILGEMSFDEQHLRLENARLKDELERLSCITQRYNIRPIQTLGHSPHLLPSLDLDMGIYSRHFQEPTGSCTDLMAMPENQEHDLQLTAGCCLILEQEKPLAMELAMNAMDELIKMCQATEPLWIRCNNGNKEVLNLEEHARLFPWPMNLKQFDENEFRREATRDSAVVIMNSITLVDAFLDANKWMDLFPSIVSRARTVQIITSGLTDHACGSLHLMHAEFQVLSPLVPTREVYFLRYCQQNVEAGIWAIVDFPVDSFQDTTHLLTSSLRYRRRPSGCIIQDMPNGYSRVIWVEHSEVEDKPVHQIFNQFVGSGQAFGAQRWLSVLQQQCERFASLMARNISDLGVIPSPEARKNLMKLAHRMLKTFCFNISSSGGQSWTALQDSSIDTVRITTRKNVEPGQPNGMILAGVTTTWLPFSHHQVFDFLRDEHKRSQLDVLSGGTSSQEVAHIANGAHPGNCISLLRINAASNSAQNVELMLQESCTDNTGSMVVYTTIDVDAVQLAMRGDDPSYIPISPAGFVITPVNNNTENGDNNNALSEGEENGGQTSGCLLTVGLQVLASTIPGAKLNLSSITAISNHICNAVHQINAVLSSIHKNNGNGSLLGGNVGEGGSCSEPTTTATAASEH